MSETDYKKALNDIAVAQARMNTGDNNAYTDYREAEFRAFDALYDSSTIEGINAIPVPELLLSKRASATGKAEYILTLRAGQYEKAGQIDLAICCFRKANALRQTYPFQVYAKKDYMRLVELLKSVRRFDEARAEEAKINLIFNTQKESVEELKKRLFDQGKAMGSHSDLVEMSDINGCCAICAQYRKRVFSLYGQDKRFPLFPANYHNDCGLIPHPFIYGISTSVYYSGDIIKFSNRPFIDDRTEQEKNIHIDALARKEEERIRELDKQDYDWLWEFMPEICPKSFNAYRRGKNANTATYQSIISEATKNGYTFKSMQSQKAPTQKPISNKTSYPPTAYCPQCGAPKRAANDFCSQCGYNQTIPPQPTQKPCQQQETAQMNNATVILWLIFLFPLGVTFMWKKTRWPKIAKIFVTIGGVIAVPYILFMFILMLL